MGYTCQILRFKWKVKLYQQVETKMNKFHIIWDILPPFHLTHSVKRLHHNQISEINPNLPALKKKFIALVFKINLKINPISLFQLNLPRVLLFYFQAPRQILYINGTSREIKDKTQQYNIHCFIMFEESTWTWQNIYAVIQVNLLHT